MAKNAYEVMSDMFQLTTYDKDIPTNKESIYQQVVTPDKFNADANTKTIIDISRYNGQPWEKIGSGIGSPDLRKICRCKTQGSRKSARAKPGTESNICALIGFMYLQILILDDIISGIATITEMEEFIWEINNLYISKLKADYKKAYINAKLAARNNWATTIGSALFKLPITVVKNLCKLTYCDYEFMEKIFI